MEYNPPQTPLTILYQDDDLIALEKPSGLLSVPGRLETHKDSLASRVQAEFPSATVVHRLDMETSGVMVMALNMDAHRHISKQFEERKTSKTYIARIWGVPEDDEGEVNAPVAFDYPNRPRHMICTETGKEAITRWKILEREELGSNEAARVELTPITGRSHQLRLHMLHIGHPILGDSLYAHPPAWQAAKRLQLHAARLSLTQPKSGKILTFESPCPF